MKKTELEIIAITIIDRVRNHHPVEDSIWELKGQLIPPDKAARQLAALANSSHSDSVYWLLGLDEKTGEINDLNYHEVEIWIEKLKSHFDEIHPEISEVNVIVEGKTLVAMEINTERKPFVVKNGDFGVVAGANISFEVPYRENKRTRSAHRSELLGMIGETIYLPEIELLQSAVRITQAKQDEGTNLYDFVFSVALYVVPVNSREIVIPFHKSSATIVIGERCWELSRDELRIAPPGRITMPHFKEVSTSETIHSTQDEAIIDGPGKMIVRGEKELEIELKNVEKVKIDIQLGYASLKNKSTITTTCDKIRNEDKGVIIYET